MKFKRVILTIILAISSIFTISSCTNSNEYKLEVVDNYNFVINDLKSSYKYNELVEVRVPFFSGMRPGIVINQEKVYYPSSTQEDLSYESIYFKMPKKNTLLETSLNDWVSETKNYTVKQIHFRYVEEADNKFVLSSENRYGYIGNYVEGYTFDKEEYNHIIDELDNYLPENYEIDGFYKDLNKTKEEFKVGYELQENLTLYYTFKEKPEISSETISANVSSESTSENVSNILPTGTFKLTIIDNDDFIYDKPNDKFSYYAPGTVLKFHSYPIMDVDLALYVDDEFYSTQYCIEVEDRYVWEYTFVMPAYDVTLKFQLESIEYNTIDNILNLPQINSSDVIKVRKEVGAIGVAPGSLTDITYSTNPIDINVVLNDIASGMVYKVRDQEAQIEGGRYIKYSIFTDNDRYDIYSANGYIYTESGTYHYCGNISYDFINISEKAHSFITYNDTYSIYVRNEGKQVEFRTFEGLKDFEFNPYEGPLYSLNKDIELFGDFGGTHFYIIDPQIFCIKYSDSDLTPTYYKLIDNQTFPIDFSILNKNKIDYEIEDYVEYLNDDFSPMIVDSHEKLLECNYKYWDSDSLEYKTYDSEKFDEKFFENNVLLCFIYSHPSSDGKPMIDSVKYYDNTLEVNYSYESSFVDNCDIIYDLLILSLNKKDLQDYQNLDILIRPNELLTELFCIY